MRLFTLLADELLHYTLDTLNPPSELLRARAVCTRWRHACTEILRARHRSERQQWSSAMACGHEDHDTGPTSVEGCFSRALRRALSRMTVLPNLVLVFAIGCGRHARPRS